MAIVGQDTFASRTVAGSFGTASDGTHWSGGSTSENVGSGFGSDVLDTSNNYPFNTFGSLALADFEVKALFRVHANSDFLALFGRNGSQNYSGYWGGGYLNLQHWNGTSGINLGGAAYTMTSGSLYWLAFRVKSSTLTLTMWPSGSTQPSPNLTATDTNITVPGTMGIQLNSASGTGVFVQSFTIDDLTSSFLEKHRRLHHGFGRIR